MEYKWTNGKHKATENFATSIPFVLSNYSEDKYYCLQARNYNRCEVLLIHQTDGRYFYKRACMEKVQTSILCNLFLIKEPKCIYK